MCFTHKPKQQLAFTICNRCGGAVKFIPKTLATLIGQAFACIEDPMVIKKILDYLDTKYELFHISYQAMVQLSENVQ
ncbi:MAG TPA: hypothetical protein ENI05_07900 [Porticoccus sp.]|nr:hypothetical protein [Porticoccus sp.]